MTILLKPENGQAAMQQLGTTELGANPGFALYKSIKEEG